MLSSALINVLVKAAGGGGLLSDFGIARIPAYTTVTQPPIRLGTAAYVAPELLLGEEATPRSDIFSFGCTVYFAMTGQMPRETPVWVAQVEYRIHARDTSSEGGISGS